MRLATLSKATVVSKSLQVGCRHADRDDVRADVLLVIVKEVANNFSAHDSTQRESPPALNKTRRSALPGSAQRLCLFCSRLACLHG